MKLAAIIATLIAVAAAAAVPAELQERQCILNGREYSTHIPGCIRIR
jgi:hypothetical protein